LVCDHANGAFGVVVRIEQVSITSPSGFFQRSQSALEFTIVVLFRTGGGFMSVARHAVKAFSVALLFLSMAVAVSAQNIAELKKQAAAGDAKAQYNLGVAYANGYGVSEDKSEAVRWWRKAADGGYVKAQFRLGVAWRTILAMVSQGMKLSRYVGIARPLIRAMRRRSSTLEPHTATALVFPRTMLKPISG
jgi:TPR repeat protein